MYKSIIFDLDGTLVDSSVGVLKSLDDTIRHFHMPDIPLEDKKKFIGPPIIQPIKAWYHLDDKKADEMFQYFRDVYKNKYLLEAIVYEGIPELLQALKRKNIKIGVATNKREDYTITMMEHFGLDKYCDCIFGSDFHNKLTKSDIIQKCLTTLQSAPGNAVMVGDSMGDWVGAKQTGLDFIAVMYGFGFSNKLQVVDSQYVCDAARDILKIFE